MLVLTRHKWLELCQNERNVFLFGSSVVLTGFCIGDGTGVWLLFNARLLMAVSL